MKASDVAYLKRKIEVEKATAKEARQDVRHQRGVAQEAKDERDRLRTEDNGASPVNSTDLNVIPDLVVHDGAAFASSLDVARVFGKPHRDVLKRIRDLIPQVSDQGGVRFFSHTPYVNSQNGQTYEAFELSNNGFALLAMGFTGAKALRFSNTTAR